MTGHKNKAAKAAAAKRQQAISGYVEEISRKDAAEIDAEKVIYAHLGTWLGRPIKIGDPIPTVMFGHKIGSFGAAGQMNDFAVQSILSASREPKVTEIKEQLSSLKDLKSDAEALRDKLSNFNPLSLAMAAHATKNMHDSVDGRVLNALGMENSLFIGLDRLSAGLTEQITSLKQDISEEPPTGRGRPKDRAALHVAEAAGAFFVSVTGRLPTHGDSPDGLTGQFTPFLRDIYDAFGWKKRSLRAGIEAAIEVGKSVKTVVRSPAINGLLGSFSSDGAD